MKPTITFDDFAKLDLRVGEVVACEDVPGSEKLWKLTVNFGEEIGEKTIYSGIRKWYGADSLTGKKYVFLINIAPKKFKIGDQELESSGMIVGAGETGAVLYTFDQDLPAGSVVR
jgi:methionyl-tRNA synthetase